MVQLLYTEIEIDRPPAEVRAVFLNFTRIPEWHTGFTIQRAPDVSDSNGANVEVGETLNVNAGGQKFNPVVLENSPEKFRWVGTLPLLLSGEHVFEFRASEKTPGSTTFIQSEEFSGVMSVMFGGWFSFGEQTQRNFARFNESLKKEVEGQ